jgi:hypothetical protein
LEFRRDVQRRTISMNRTRMDFTVVDKQMTVPLPPNVVLLDANHSISNPQNINFCRWVGTITATYEMHRLGSGIDAYAHFRTFVLKRLRMEEAYLEKKKYEQFIVPLKFSATEPEVYGRRKAQFSFIYSVAFCKKDQEAANNQVFIKRFEWYVGSLFSVDNNLTFDDWRASMNDKAWQPTGNIKSDDGIGIRYDTEIDIDHIIDLCKDIPPDRIQKGGPGDNKDRTFSLFDEPYPIPTREASWLAYHNIPTVEPDSGVIEHRPLPTSITTPATPNPEIPLQTFGGNGLNKDRVQSLGQPIDWNPGEPGEVDDTADAQETIFQRRMGRRDEIVINGWALRAAYPPQVPIIDGPYVRADNRSKGDFFRVALVGNAGVPIYFASWQLRFKRVSVTKTIDIPATPYFPPPPSPGDSTTSFGTTPDNGDLLS